jgi:hypothetical protein
LSASSTMRSPRTAGSLTQSAKLLVRHRFLWHLLFKVFLTRGTKQWFY